jgi:Rrf2 family iron-sulfur cluster assembly transcriptional regulator
VRLSTRGRYAVMAMVDLADEGHGRPITLADIATRQDISLSYLEQLFAKLRRGGIVRSVRGPGGGYRLARGADAIFVASIIDAVDEQVDATRCGGEGTCQDGEKCLTHYLWQDLSTQIHSFLAGISLGDLVRRQDVRAVSDRQRDKHRVDLVNVR